MLLRLCTLISAACFQAGERLREVVSRRPDYPADGGQATAEYALVLLGAATVALLLIAWATKTGKISALLDAIVDRILDKV
ncbi:MAG: DUF4244 domain-containing protein [Acidimicrobiales bacterium]